MSQAQTLLLKWFDENKRDLPWRLTKDPYRIWISEIMLQQTRTETVRGYYLRFLERFPTIQKLASAPEQDVLKLWEGLGYYSRARNLQKAAQCIVRDHGGLFPDSYEEILSLPGIGPYTAGAVGSIAFGLRVPAIDGNVYRVAARFFGIRDDIGQPGVQRAIRTLVQELLPDDRPGDFNQGLMELGATCCCPGTARCEACPWAELCDACLEGDADLLPVHEKKRPPKVLELGVCLLIRDGQVLTFRRKERMLNGLSVFFLAEDASTPEDASELLTENGISCRFERNLGHARHVFTHRVWEMEILLFSVDENTPDPWASDPDAVWADRRTLQTLPFPSAMRAAVDAVIPYLS